MSFVKNQLALVDNGLTTTQKYYYFPNFQDKLKKCISAVANAFCILIQVPTKLGIFSDAMLSELEKRNIVKIVWINNLIYLLL